MGNTCVEERGHDERGRHPSSLVLESTKNIRVTSVGDGDGRHTEVLTATGTEVDAVALVVVHGGLGEHGVVLNLGLSQRRAVVGDENELGYA